MSEDNGAPQEGDSLWPQPKSMRRPHQIASIVLAAFAVFIIVTALDLRYYTSLGPGPGFFSLWLGVVLAVLALLMFLSATIGAPEETRPNFFADLQGYGRVGSILLSLAVAALLFKPLGYILTMLVVLTFLLGRVGRVGWPVTVIGALMGSFGVYYVFVHWLKVPLPAGLLGI